MYDEKSISSSSYYLLQTDLFIRTNAELSGWPWFWKNVTELGDALVFFPLIAFLIIRSPQTWAALFGAVPLSALLSSVGKSMTAVPRPAAVLEHDQFNIVGSALTGHTSLPSGHTITGIAIVTVLVSSMMLAQPTKTRRYWILMGGIIVGGLIAISRVAVGAHWPIDVLVGASIGIVGGGSGVLLARSKSGWWAWVETARGQTIFGFIMLFWGASLVHKAMATGDAELIVPKLAALSAIGVGLYLLTRTLVLRFRN